MRSETGWLCFALLCFVLFCLHVVSCFGVVGSHTINYSFIHRSGQHGAATSCASLQESAQLRAQAGAQETTPGKQPSGQEQEAQTPVSRPLPPATLMHIVECTHASASCMVVASGRKRCIAVDARVKPRQVALLWSSHPWLCIWTEQPRGIPLGTPVVNED